MVPAVHVPGFAVSFTPTFAVPVMAGVTVVSVAGAIFTPAEVFDFLGIKASVVLAGLSGGILRALSRRSYKARELVASPICGALAAGYLTTPAVHYLGVVNWPLPPDQLAAQHAAAFLIGVSAMWISDALFEVVARRLRRGGK